MKVLGGGGEGGVVFAQPLAGDGREVAGEAGLQLCGGNCGNLALWEFGNAASFAAGGAKYLHG